MKKIIHLFHLWLGLASSLILFIICLSGSLLTFKNEIEVWLGPETYLVTPQNSHQLLRVDDLIHKMEKFSGGKVVGLTSFPEENRSYQVNVKLNPGDRRGRPYFVNPYSGEILQQSEKLQGFFFLVFRLHRWLLLDENLGRPIVGISTLVFCFLLLSGLYLWWPKNKTHLKNSLKIKISSNGKRLNYDLHNTLGFYSFIILLVMGLTGLFWSFEWYRNLGSKILQTRVFDRSRKETPVTPSLTRKSYEELIGISHQYLSYPAKTVLILPEKKTQPITILKTQTDYFSLQGMDKIEINPYDGKVILVERFSEKTLGQKIASLIKPLHTGEFMGVISKLIYFIGSLVATSLPITGFFIWFNKRRKYA